MIMFLLGFLLQSVTLRLSGTLPKDDIAYPVTLFVLCLIVAILTRKGKL